MLPSRVAITLVLLSLAGSGHAQEKLPPTNALVDAVVRCRAEAGEDARLHCYDIAAAALSEATARGSIVVVDKEDVRKTRRSLFGFALPKLPFFGGDDSGDDQPDEIEARIKSVRGLGYGKWVIELDTGAKWQTTETSGPTRDPKPGQTMKIKKGAMGGYFLTVEGGRGVRGMRVG
jgi:hypothetical protein